MSIPILCVGTERGAHLLVSLQYAKLNVFTIKRKGKLMAHEQEPPDVPASATASPYLTLKLPLPSGRDSEEKEDQEPSQIGRLPTSILTRLLYSESLPAPQREQITQQRFGQQNRAQPTEVPTTSNFHDTTPTVVNDHGQQKTVPRWLADRMNERPVHTGNAELDERLNVRSEFDVVGDHIVERTRSPYTGQIFSELWWTKDGKLDRPDGPAVIDRDMKTNALNGVEYYVNGKLHRMDGPAVDYPGFAIEYRHNGMLVNGPDGFCSRDWRPETGLLAGTTHIDGRGYLMSNAGPGLFPAAPGIGRMPTSATQVFILSPEAEAKNGNGPHKYFETPDGQKIAYTMAVSRDTNLTDPRYLPLWASGSQVVGYGNAATRTFSLSSPASVPPRP
jgi:hypothetical protein